MKLDMRVLPLLTKYIHTSLSVFPPISSYCHALIIHFFEGRDYNGPKNNERREEKVTRVHITSFVYRSGRLNVIITAFFSLSYFRDFVLPIDGRFIFLL